MNEKPVQRKARQYFDTASSPSHVTFDTGTNKRNLPWSTYVEARWDQNEPDFIRVEIGDYLVHLRGHNLGPLFLAIEDRMLVRVRARPDLEEDRANEPDSFITGVVFQKAEPATPFGGKGKQFEIDLAG